MGRKIATYGTANCGYCEVHFDYKEEYGYIKYFDNSGKMYYTEDYRGRSLQHVHDVAENWVSGTKRIEGVE